MNKEIFSKAYCVNLKERNDRFEQITKEIARVGLNVEFFRVDRDPEGGALGCLRSHVALIKKAKELNLPYIFIIEDDVVFLDSIDNIPEPPPDWDMLYLGANIRAKYATPGEKKGKYSWCRGTFATTHCYAIKASLYDKVITEAEESGKEIDRFYSEDIHPKPEHRAYLIYPIIANQTEGFSDIEGRYVNYDFMLSQEATRKPIDTADYELKNGNIILKLDDPHLSTDKEVEDYIRDVMPKVSIVTLVHDRPEFIPLMIKNYYEMKYPREKLEWIIVDDGKVKINKYLPSGDDSIKYFYAERADPNVYVSIPCKRNIGAQNASGTLIVHMDDDDIYFPTSIMTKVKVLLKYKQKQCVGCSKIGSFDIINMISLDSAEPEDPTAMSEASMAYWKTFWEERHFDESMIAGEGKTFLAGRTDKVIDIPYPFSGVALTHKKNTTGRLRSIEGRNIDPKVLGEQKTSFWDELFDEQHKQHIRAIKTYQEGFEEYMRQRASKKSTITHNITE